ncbi:L-rhamnose/proton symporter RhaT [Sediminitomix flava]|uniref:L-rhamnose-H+ transport protein n=1 Tax=Sediminitomix flava TaxID=379075 RepID=A0A315Z8T0_SEDFL|nr:L-rhamnose/proton symporter RhaT [Sediminitomix flava]PWJ41790.1 L-rhamnose-H+ transport protein [Sediminitomix flava]
MFLALTLILFASFFQGSFGLGMKHISPVKWEAWWLIHAFIAMVVFPVGWAMFAVPDFLTIIFATDLSALMLAMLFGFLWGIGGILFGVSVEYTGISITYGIVMGLAASMGSIIPLFQIEGAFSDPSFKYIALGIVLLLVGVVITAVAGVKRDRLQTDSKEDSASKSIKVGVMIAITSGVLSAFLNVGFSNAAPVAQMATSQFNIDPKDASLVAWVVVLFGAFIMNGGFALYKLSVNNSWSAFKTVGAQKSFVWAIVSGLFWFAALGVYGRGAALMGDLGPVVGWPMLLGLALIISNIWAYRSGEWSNAKRPFQILLQGLVILIVATCVLGYSNY